MNVCLTSLRSNYLRDQSNHNCKLSFWPLPSKFLSDNDKLPVKLVSVEYPTPKLREPVGASTTSTFIIAFSLDVPSTARTLTFSK